MLTNSLINYSTIDDERIDGIQLRHMVDYSNIQVFDNNVILFHLNDNSQTLHYCDTTHNWICDCGQFRRIASSGYISPFCRHVIAIESLVLNSLK